VDFDYVALANAKWWSEQIRRFPGQKERFARVGIALIEVAGGSYIGEKAGATLTPIPAIASKCFP
jgi:hypothetical protein